MITLGAFAGDAICFMRNTLDKARPSDDERFCIHDSLRALLTVYLPPRAAKEWRDILKAFVWNDCFARTWTRATRLHDLRKVITTLTVNDHWHACIVVSQRSRVTRVGSVEIMQKLQASSCNMIGPEAMTALTMDSPRLWMGYSCGATGSM